MNADVVLYWIRSERDSSRPNPHGDRIEQRCRAAAAATGMDLRAVSVDDVVVSHDGVRASVRVRGGEVFPDSTFFHTKLMSWPAYETDAWRHLTTYSVLEAAGFCVTVPALHSIINNDKMLSCIIQDFCDIRALPTIRLSTRGYQPSQTDFDTLGLEFPAVVKPAGWGGGNAVLVVHSPGELSAVLGLAGAAEMTMVMQPWLGPDTLDYRIYCLDGEPRQASVRRVSAGGLAGNVTQGGSAELIAVPERFAHSAGQIARTIGLPYVCVDFLQANGTCWFSEIEVDGGTSVGGHELTTMRFGAYRRLFDRFAVSPAAARHWTFS